MYNDDVVQDEIALFSFLKGTGTKKLLNCTKVLPSRVKMNVNVNQCICTVPKSFNILVKQFYGLCSWMCSSRFCTKSNIPRVKFLLTMCISKVYNKPYVNDRLQLLARTYYFIMIPRFSFRKVSVRVYNKFITN